MQHLVFLLTKFFILFEYNVGYISQNNVRV